MVKIILISIVYLLGYIYTCNSLSYQFKDNIQKNPSRVVIIALASTISWGYWFLRSIFISIKVFKSIK